MKKNFILLTLISLVSPTPIFSLTPIYREPSIQKEVRASEQDVTDAGTLRTIRNSTVLNKTTVGRPASSSREIPVGKPLNDFCSHVDKIIVAIDGKVTTSENSEKKEEVQDELRVHVDALRAQNNAKRKTKIDELNKRVTGNLELSAIQSFVASMDNALSIKNTAVDALLTSYRKEIDQATSTRKAAFDKAFKTLEADVVRAKIKAKNDCANGVAGVIVRSNLKNALQNAQETFKKTAASTEKVKDTTLAIRNAKKLELKKIESDFKNNIEQARNDLKQVLKK